MDTARSVAGVRSVDDIRMRWHGHRMLITMLVAVDPEATVRQGHHIAQAVGRIDAHTLNAHPAAERRAAVLVVLDGRELPAPRTGRETGR